MPVISTTEQITCDVLVIGGGAAGSCAVSAALERGARVCLAVKGYYGLVGMRGSGASACGNTEGGLPRLPDIAGIRYDRDDMMEHAITAGLGMADPALVETLADNAIETRKDLEKWGCSFHAVGAAGLGYPFIRAAEKKIRSNAVVLEHTMIYDLILNDGVCSGAAGIDSNGVQYIIHSPAVVIAAGGNAELFQRNVHPGCTTGDGYALALRAGAKLMNMEFLQMFTASVYPTRNLIHTWKPEQLEKLYNINGRQFLDDYLPPDISADQCREENARHAPFSTRDPASRYLAVAVMKEILAGRGSEHGGVFLDMRDSVKAVRPYAMDFLRYKGIDVDAQPVEITVAHQCSNGGIRVSKDAGTEVPGLFAAGEAITGTHGADRIGANMLAQCAVFGRLAGISASAYASSNKTSITVGPAEFPLQKCSQTYAAEAAAYRSELRETAWSCAMVVRNQNGLQRFMDLLNSSDEQFFGWDDHTSPNEAISLLELRNLILVGKALCLSAAERKESRGPHYREDYPEIDVHQEVKASQISLSSEGKVVLEKILVDPGWDHDRIHGLKLKRWG